MKLKWKPVVFVLILLALIFLSETVLDNIGERKWKEMDDIHKYPDSYDVCFLGPSTVRSNISVQELYERYGIAGIPLSGLALPMHLMRYVLEEVLEYQSPKVVFIDISPMFYSDNAIRDWAYDTESYTLSTILDGIRTPSIRWNALNEAHLYNEHIGICNYSKLSYLHENWKRLFNGSLKNTNENIENYMLFERGGLPSENIDIVKHENERELNDETEQYLLEMVELCNESNVEVVLLAQHIFCSAEHENIERLAKKYGIRFLDFNEYMEEIDFSYGDDLSDILHLNMSGAVKWSDFLGRYLSDNYDFTDKRMDPAYERYELRRELHYKQKKFISNVSFRQYLSELIDLDKDENVVFVSVYDEAVNHLKEADFILLNELGLKAELLENDRSSYAAVIHGAEVQEEFALDDTVTIKGMIDDLYYEVTSGGMSSGGNASIVLDGKDYIQKGRGFNFVVYNKESGRIKDSVYFDTHELVNPPKGEDLKESIKNSEVKFPDGTFREYLSNLGELDTTEYAILISVYDEATTFLTDQDMALLKRLGLKTNLLGQYRSSYAAVIHGAEVQEKLASDDTVTIKGMIDDLYYEVTSGGMSSGGNASIVLDGKDYIQKGRGFNFVVYNLESGRIKNSVYFDTYAQVNPRKGEDLKESFEDDKVEYSDGTFRAYLSHLADLDTTEHAILISVYDEATTSLTELDMALLERLGLKTNLLGQNRCSYAAAIYDSEIKEKFALKDTVTIQGNIGGKSYKVTSGGLESGGNASIELDGEEFIRKGRGFNFVIYNLKTGQVEESVYFDTYANVNPNREEKVLDIN